MRLVILNDVADVAEWSAKYVMKRINEFKPSADRYFTLGLPTGMLLIEFNSFFRYIVK